MEKKQTTSLTENSQTFLCLKNQINKFFPMLDFLKIAEHTKVLWPGRIKNWQQTPCICYFSVSLSWSMTNSLMVWIMNSPLDSQLKAWTPAFGMSVDGPHREDVGSPERCSSNPRTLTFLFLFGFTTYCEANKSLAIHVYREKWQSQPLDYEVEHLKL